VKENEDYFPQEALFEKWCEGRMDCQEFDIHHLRHFFMRATVLNARFQNAVITDDVIRNLVGNPKRVNQLIGNDKEGVAKRMKIISFFVKVKQFFCFHKVDKYHRCSKCRKFITIGGK
jgi:hypothetical protein